MFTPQAFPEFQQDSTNSLIAAYDYEEISDLLDAQNLGNWQHKLSKWLCFYQIHQYPIQGDQESHKRFWVENHVMSKIAVQDYKGLEGLFLESNV